MLLNSGGKFGLVAKAFHWVLAVYLVGMFVFGKYLASMTVGFSNLHLFNWHKVFGLIALTLIVLRLVWRFVSPPPPTLTEGSKPWELKLAHSTHVMLYVLMLGMPMTGWIASSATAIEISFFNLFNVPLIAPPSEPMENLFFALHRLFGFLLLVFVALHVAGALKRHFILRDMTLRRMWF